jgi:hypothetical protein
MSSCVDGVQNVLRVGGTVTSRTVSFQVTLRVREYCTLVQTLAHFSGVAINTNQQVLQKTTSGAFFPAS